MVMKYRGGFIKTSTSHYYKTFIISPPHLHSSFLESVLYQSKREHDHEDCDNLVSIYLLRLQILIDSS